MWRGTSSRRRSIAQAAVLASMIVLGVAWQPDSAAARISVNGEDADPAAARAAVGKEITLELISTAENSTKDWTSAYAYIEDIGDGRGFTAGIVGFCSGTGDMLDLVRYYSSTTPGNPLQRYLPALWRIMAAPYASRPALSHLWLGQRFAVAWVSAAKTAQFQDAQRAERDRVYWNPALAAAKQDGLSRLGLYVYYDISVNHGPGRDPGSFGGIIAEVKAHGHRSPAQGGSEIGYLRAIVEARDAVLRDWGDFQVDGRSTIARRLLSDENLDLRLPLRWTIYGDAFSITTLPPLSEG